MRVKYTNLAVLAAFLVLAMSSVSTAVNVADIDDVRDKEVLDSQDLQTIDNFVAEAVGELVRTKTKDFTSIARIRTVILSRSSSRQDGARAQYAEQFYESAYNHISKAFKDAENFERQDRKFKVTLNLLILVDNLENLRLIDLAIPILKDDSAAIRYWAVHSVTNPGIRKKLTSSNSDNSKLAQRITEQLKGLVDSSGPEIVALIAEFAAEVNIPKAEQLLLQIADMRAKRYADWRVQYELLDIVILRFLCEKISASGQNKAAIARRFGQLYSYTIQRYVKGQAFLSAAQKHQLASVLVETEDKCIRKLLGRRQSTIKKAVEQDNVTSLLLEHNRLLGDKTRAGNLAVKLKFDYGENPDGSKRTAPKKLPEYPKKETSLTKAET